MKRRFLFLCSLWALLMPLVAQKPTQVLMIGLDGISTEGLQAAQTPNIDRLMHEGAYTYKARNVIPSNTLPNWTSAFCGSGPERHGVTANSWTVSNRTLSSVSMDDDGYYPSIFKLVKEQVPGVTISYYWNWKALINSINPAYLDESNYLANDAYVANFERAFEYMRENKDKPFLTFLYDVHTDHAGHGHKWMSAPYIKAIEDADAQIGILLDKLKAEGMYDDMYIFFLTDHGGIGSGHGGYSDTEMNIPFSVKGKGIKQGEIKDIYFTVNTGSTIARIFGIQQPQEWAGKVVESMFGLANPSILPSATSDDAIYYTIQNISEGTYLSVVDGKIIAGEKADDNSTWYLTQSDAGKYVLCNKACPDKALGEIDGVPALVDKQSAAAWFLCPNPEKAGAYSIAQSADASVKCLKAGTDGVVGYWTPSAFCHAGILWSLSSDDPRTLIDEKRADLAAAVKSADKYYNTIKDRISDNIPGSYTEGTGALLSTALEASRALMENAQATVEEIVASIEQLQSAVSQTQSMPTVAFESGATYRIKNADLRFGGLAYMYSTDAHVIRWGVVKPEINAASYDWKLTVEKDENGSDIVTLFNVGTGRYLGSSAWDAARPSSINTTDGPCTYRFDNTKGEDLREWCLRSIDSEGVQNPEKSYLACTDDNDNNLVDGRVLPWDPTSSTAMHDGYWIFEKVADSETSEEIVALQQNLLSAVSKATAFATLMEKTLQTKTVGSYTSQEALAMLKSALESAAGATESTSRATLEAALATLNEKLETAKSSPQVTFKDGATYRIVNADPRFEKDPIRLYINSSDVARWGIESKVDPAGSDTWVLKLEGEDFLLQNVRTGKYLGSSAWDASRPSKIVVAETPVPYQIVNTFGEDPREWCLRSTDSYHVLKEESSYLACSGDNDKNLAEGSIRPWNPTDAKVGLHDSFWTFEEVEIPTDISSVGTHSEQIQVVNGRIVVTPPATPFTVYTIDGKQQEKNVRLTAGVYIVNIQDKSYKVQVNL